MFGQVLRYLRTVAQESRFPDRFFAAIALGTAALIVLVLQLIFG
jgi:hypothetical protein